MVSMRDGITIVIVNGKNSSIVRIFPAQLRVHKHVRNGSKTHIGFVVVVRFGLTHERGVVRSHNGVLTMLVL